MLSGCCWDMKERNGCRLGCENPWDEEIWTEACGGEVSWTVLSNPAHFEPPFWFKVSYATGAEVCTPGAQVEILHKKEYFFEHH